MKKLEIIAASAIVFAAVACEDTPPVSRQSFVISPSDVTVSTVAKIISELPIGQEQLDEVYEAVNSSSGNGFDEEYMMDNLFRSPGSGVGSSGETKSTMYNSPLRDLFSDYLRDNMSTKGGESDVEAYINAMIDSGMQIYWPYSEDWDGETFPVVTFDPGYGAETNLGYEINMTPDGAHVVKTVLVDEALAMQRPVWVINTNDDSAYTPLDFYLKEGKAGKGAETASESGSGLVIHSFTALRNYDTWFGGASEFFIKCGAVDGFKATKDDDLRLYTPSVTDLMLVVKRKQVGHSIPLDAILLTELTDQMENVAFMIVEDDGGTSTSWKCEATVKYNSKAYGFNVEIPYKDKDDIVWRGQLGTSFFTKGAPVEGRFGDVKVSFQLR